MTTVIDSTEKTDTAAIIPICAFLPLRLSPSFAGVLSSSSFPSTLFCVSVGVVFGEGIASGVVSVVGSFVGVVV